MDRKGILFAVLSTFGFGLFPILVKKGFIGIPLYTSGVIAIAAGLIAFTILMLVTGKFKGFVQDPHRAIAFFLIVGVSNTLAIAFLYKALQLSLAFVVVPLTSTYPLLTIAFSPLILKGGERPGKNVLIGACLVIGGTLLILFSK